MDHSLEQLQARKNEWVDLSIEERIRILDEILENLAEAAPEWVNASLRMKESFGSAFAEGEEWVSIWPLFRDARILRQSLEDIRKHGRPQTPGSLVERPDGQVVARVFPQSTMERMLFLGTTAEVWMEPGVTAEAVLEDQASAYSDPELEGKVVLVLGAGNIPALPFNQALYQLFVRLHVAILKFSPINAYVGPFMEQAFRPLIDRGFLQTVYGGVSEGAYLCDHPQVDEIQLAGGDKTFSAIVFGSGEEQVRRKADRDPKLRKSIEAELGNVSPVIVVPGPWSQADIEYHANYLATMQAFNSGYYCLTPRVIVQHKNWDQRQALIDGIGNVFSDLPTRKAWYPGAQEIHQTFLTEHPEAQQFGDPPEDHLPWTFIVDVDPTIEDDIAFKTEGFCSLFAETALEAESVPEYLEKAVAFVNDTLWGTLCATILVHPGSLKQPGVKEAVEQAIANLRYGTVTVNTFTGFAYCYSVTPWGGFPHDNIYDIQSGIGVIKNSLMFEQPQKSVVRAPFKQFPNPFRVDAAGLPAFAKRLAYYDADPTVGKLMGVFWSALRA